MLKKRNSKLLDPKGRILTDFSMKGDKIHELHEGRIYAFAFFPPNTMVSGGNDGHISISNMKTGKRVNYFSSGGTGHSVSVNHVSKHKSDSFFAVFSNGKFALYRFDTTFQEARVVFDFSLGNFEIYRVKKLEFKSKPHLLMSMGSNTGSVRLFSIGLRKIVRFLDVGKINDWTCDLHLSLKYPNSRFYACTRDSGAPVKMCDLELGVVLKSYDISGVRGFPYAITSFLSPSNDEIVCISGGMSGVLFFDSETTEQIHEIRRDNYYCYSLNFLPGLNSVMVGDGMKLVLHHIRFEGESSQKQKLESFRIADLEAHTNDINGITFIENRSSKLTLATCSDDSCVVYYELSFKVLDDTQDVEERIAFVKEERESYFSEWLGVLGCKVPRFLLMK